LYAAGDGGSVNVAYWPKADMAAAVADVRSRW
jgi:hypothetical protein